MRAEDKQLDLEVEQVEKLVEDKALDEDHDHAVAVAEIAAPIIEEIRDEQREILQAAVCAIFARETVQISGLDLPAKQLEALEYLHAAVTGRERLGRFVYAEDRRDMLENALGVLDLRELAEIDDVVVTVETLRAELTNLEDAQEEIPLSEKAEWFDSDKSDDDDTDDNDDKDDKHDDDNDGGDRNGAPSTLDGPALPGRPAAPSTLDGPALPAQQAAPSTLDGPALPVAPAAPSMLDGPDVQVAAKPPSSLYEETPTLASRIARRLGGLTTPPQGVPVLPPADEKKLASSPAISIPKPGPSNPTPTKPPRRGGGGHRG